MKFHPVMIFLIIALVFWIMAAIGRPKDPLPFNLTASGLFFFGLYFLFNALT